MSPAMFDPHTHAELAALSPTTKLELLAFIGNKMQTVLAGSELIFGGYSSDPSKTAYDVSHAGRELWKELDRLLKGTV